MDEPLVSVVIPAYRAEDTLRETLESVLAQSLGAWEALVVDDGSEDRTGEVARDAAARDPRIRVLEHPDCRNRGVSASRNLAIRSARGRYVAFLDADDVWTPDALAVLSAAFGSGKNLVLVWGRARTVGDPGIDEGGVRGAGVPGVPVAALPQLARANVVVTSAAMVRRSALGEDPFAVGLPFQIEDWVLWLDLAEKGPFLFVDEEVAVYRVRSQGATVRAKRGPSAAAFEVAQARILHERLERATGGSRRALLDGLAYRACDCLRCSISRLRRGRLREAVSWARAAVLVAGGPLPLVRAAALLPGEHRRSVAGKAPLVPPTPWPGG